MESAIKMSAAAPSRRILFVDDEPGILATLPGILRRDGYRVDTAASVPEALESIRHQDFDALICDLNLEEPGDGYRVIDAIREFQPRCIVIVLTGYPAFESALEGIHRKIDEYLIKPSDPDALLSSLAKLSRHTPRARILSVSYDIPLLRTRHMLLEREGYEVVSTSDLATSLEQCKDGRFDLFLLGHSIPHSDKQRFVEAFRRVCPVPIISLRRNMGEQPVDGADFQVEPDPEPLLKIIAQIAHAKNSKTRQF
jgi:CheY-like chemotaxis protein